MAQEIKPWQPSTTLSLEHRWLSEMPALRDQARAAIAGMTTPSAALQAAKQLVAQWPHVGAPHPDTYAAALGAVLAQYPPGVVRECCDPRTGLARTREFPPTVAAIVEWCDRRLKYYQGVARLRCNPPAPKREFSAEHCGAMLKRWQALLLSLVGAMAAGHRKQETAR